MPEAARCSASAVAPASLMAVACEPKEAEPAATPGCRSTRSSPASSPSPVVVGEIERGKRVAEAGEARTEQDRVTVVPQLTRQVEAHGLGRRCGVSEEAIQDQCLPPAGGAQ